jgi:hypothetical protein
MMVERILEEVKEKLFEDPPREVEYSDEEVLGTTGPAGWTEVLFGYLNSVVEEPVTWKNLTSMRKPGCLVMFCCCLLMGLRRGVPHLGASESTVEASLVKHQFSRGWRNGVD